jgi:hypothetical protein
VVTLHRFLSLSSHMRRLLAATGQATIDLYRLVEQLSLRYAKSLLTHRLG